jgi:hypothetical protein
MDKFLNGDSLKETMDIDFSSILSEMMNNRSHEDEKCMNDIYDTIGNFDKVQLLKRLSALRLFYENRNKAPLIDGFMTIILNWLNDHNWNDSGIQMSYGKFKNLIQKINNSSLSMAIDPLDDPYIDRILFYGNHLVLSGINSMSTYKLNIAIATLFKSDKVSEFVDNLENISRTLFENLVVSTNICEKIESRKDSEGYHRKIFVPSQKDLKNFEKLVVLDTQSVYIKQLEINKDEYETISPLPNDYHIFIKKPYLNTSEGIIVLDASSIANSLYFEITSDFGVEFVKNFNSKVWKDIKLSLRNLGHHKVLDDSLGIELINTSSYKEGLFTVSNDRLLFVIFKSSNSIGISEDIEILERISTINEAYVRKNATNKKLLVLSIGYADIGSFGINLITSEIDVPVAQLSPFELKAISVNEMDNLFIPRFLETKDRLDNFNGINIYGDFNSMVLFSENQMSMYVSDDVDYRQASLAFMPEETSDYYEKMFENKDIKLFHSSFDNNWYEGVRENYQGPYFAMETQKGLRCFVESQNFKQIEIVTNDFYNADDFNLFYPIYDMVSYWLSAYYSNVNLNSSQLLVLNFTESTQILREANLENLKPLKIDIIEIDYAYVLNIDQNLFGNLIKVSDNSVEKQIIKNLIFAFDYRISDEKMQKLFEPKYKKKIAVHFDDEEGLLAKRIVKKNQPQVSEYETSLLLDEIGSHLLKEGYPHGILPEDENQKFCHSIVDYLLGVLKKEIRMYRKESLLEVLIHQIEFLLSEQKNNERSYHINVELNPKQQQNFFNQLNKDNENSLSTKFLLEYVATVQDFGSQQIDFWHLERLLAICALIIEWAHREDYFKYNLVSTKINFLESNRIGIKKSDFGKVNEAFYSSREIQLAYDLYDDIKNEDLSKKALAILDSNLDLAFEEMFGYSNEQFQNVFSAIIDIFSGERVVHKVEKQIFLNKIYEFLGENISNEVIQKIVSSVTLSEREEFLMKVEGYQFSDTFPWIFNRELSFIRRPIISYGEYFYFGVRNIIHMKKYIYQLIKEARLKTSSNVMKKLESDLANILGEKFNQEIAQIVSRLSNLEVFTEVKKINDRKIIDSDKNELGDIDVLAINRKSRKIFIIETKNFNYARNPFEISKELEKVFTGKKSFVKKHLKRFDWVENNFDDLKVEYHLDDGNWKVIPMFIISEYLIARDIDVDKTIKIISRKEINNMTFK